MKKLIEYLYRYFRPKAKDDIRRKCVNYLFPFALEFQRSLPSAIRFVMVDTYGDELFTLLNDKEDTLCDCCENCAREMNYQEKLLRELRNEPEEFLHRYELSTEAEDLKEVADIEMHTIPSDTDYYGIPHCNLCGAVLDMNCVPEGEELLEDLNAYGKLETLRSNGLRLLDLWYIAKLLYQAGRSEQTYIQEAADKLAQRIYMENNLKDMNL